MRRFCAHYCFFESEQKGLPAGGSFLLYFWHRAAYATRPHSPCLPPWGKVSRAYRAPKKYRRTFWEEEWQALRARRQTKCVRLPWRLAATRMRGVRPFVCLRAAPFPPPLVIPTERSEWRDLVLNEKAVPNTAKRVSNRCACAQDPFDFAARGSARRSAQGDRIEDRVRRFPSCHPERAKRAEGSLKIKAAFFFRRARRGSGNGDNPVAAGEGRARTGRGR